MFLSSRFWSSHWFVFSVFLLTSADEDAPVSDSWHSGRDKAPPWGRAVLGMVSVHSVQRMSLCRLLAVCQLLRAQPRDRRPLPHQT